MCISARIGAQTDRRHLPREVGNAAQATLSVVRVFCRKHICGSDGDKDCQSLISNFGRRGDICPHSLYM